MGLIFPPIPWTKGIDEYETALLQRFRAGAFDVADAASKSATSARELEQQFKRALDALDAADPHRQTLEDHISNLRKAADAADTVARTWDTQYRPCEEAATYVRSSVDLQVAKASGLLAFVAIAAAIAVGIWPIRVPPTSSVTTVTFCSLAVGSLMSLCAIWAHWGHHRNYSSPSADLRANLNFAAVRSWIGNVATLASLVSAAAIGFWVAAGTAPEGKPTPQLVLPDSATVRCLGREFVGVRGKPDVDSLVCVVRR